MPEEFGIAVWSCDSCDAVQVWVRPRPNTAQHPAGRSGVKGKNPQQVPVKLGCHTVAGTALRWWLGRGHRGPRGRPQKSRFGDDIT
ncbi:Rho GTPase-activating protein 45 [Dissostichus eleginoides]|uniref:Rho GTPase-activating protein 45 n=1 Tax=Dissostichus eleginoides TaxID=100907 RepID=A0AAD9F616_DISEL|nr:Rho GTPase-activating protein 45 [Dissostichus eleginoides]